MDAPGTPRETDAPLPVEHGGDTAGAEARFGWPRHGWLDLSTGISPEPYPTGDWAPEWSSRLPGRALYGALKEAAASYFEAAGDSVLAVPGSQAAIQWLPRLRGRSRVAVIGPTYGEHERSWRAGGHDVTVVSGLDAAAGFDVVVVANPNNPDGRRLDPGALRALARRRGAAGGWLVVDEAFIDVTPEHSVAGRGGESGLIVLRSFGKFFGLAGLRLGFVIAEPRCLEALGAALGPWAVSGPAAGIGARAFADRPWIEAARVRLRDQSARLETLLSRRGLAVVGATSYFCLVETPVAAKRFGELARAGILVRTFAADPRRLRFGLPGGEAAWRRLEAALGVEA